MKYWLLQNSWGTRWGRGGLIQLIRHDDEDSWCGNDSRPQDGSACDGEADQNVTVCGSCGILYDPVVPRLGPVMIGNLPYGATSAAMAAKPDAGTEADVAKLDQGMQAYQGQDVPYTATSAGMAAKPDAGSKPDVRPKNDTSRIQDP